MHPSSSAIVWLTTMAIAVSPHVADAQVITPFQTGAREAPAESEGQHGASTRELLKRLKWGITVFFLALGLLTLAAYMKIGYEHRNRAGERYIPSHLRPLAPTGHQR